MEQSEQNKNTEQEIDVVLTDSDRLRIDENIELVEAKFEQRSIYSALKIPAILIASFSIITISLFLNSSLPVKVKDIFGITLEIKAREYLKKSPEVSPKLKILVYDDLTLHKLQNESLSLIQWANLLKKLDQYQPKAIYIDKIFGILSDHTNEESKALEIFKSIKTPIYSGAYQTPYKIRGRASLADTFEQNKSHFIKVPSKLKYFEDQKSLNTYGAHRKLMPFLIPGHILLSHSYLIDAMVLAKENYTIPHLSLRNINNLKISQLSNSLYIDETRAEILEGKLPVNFLNPVSYLKNARQFHRILHYSEKKMRKFIKPGDSLVLLPTFYTGSGDWKESPHGKVNGGFIILNLLNSVLTKNFLGFFFLDGVFLYLSAILGISLLIIGSKKMIFLAILFPGLLFAFGMWLFVEFGEISAWREWAIAFLFTGILSLFMRRQADKKISQEASQKLSEAKILANEKLVTEAREKVLLSEKKQAAEIAKTLQPDSAPTDWPFSTLDTFHTCFDAASGDWFFFRKSKSDKYYHIGLFDISGHGIQAALVVSCCRATILNFERLKPEAFERDSFFEEFCHELNAILYSQGKGKHASTFCGVTFKEDSDQVKMMSCGHPPPIIIDWETRETKRIRTRSSILGISSNLDVSSVDFVLEKKQDLYLYSDGCGFNEKFKFFRKSIAALEKELPYSADLVPFFQESLNNKFAMVIDDDVSLIHIKR